MGLGGIAPRPEGAAPPREIRVWLAAQPGACVQDVKARSRRLSALVESFGDAYDPEVGQVQRVCVVDRAAKNGKLVAHNKRYTQVCQPLPSLSSATPTSLLIRSAVLPPMTKAATAGEFAVERRGGSAGADGVCLLQVLVDEEPGLLGSIVDVEITGRSRWCTFGVVREWIYRCPPPQPASPGGSAGLLKARARVAAARGAAKATAQPPPRAAGAAAPGAAPAGRAASGAAGREGGADGGDAPAGTRRRGRSWVGWDACAAARESLARLVGSAGKSQSQGRGGDGHARHAGVAGMPWWRLGGRLSGEDALLLGAAAVGLAGLAAGGVLVLQQRRGGPP